MKSILISTRAKDVYINSENKVIDEQIGGPALFIMDYFNKNNYVPTQEIITHGFVEILLNDSGEFGYIKDVENMKTLPYSDNEFDVSILSTLLDEFPLEECLRISKSLCVDIQGYVRIKDNPNKKQVPIFPNSFYQKLAILKASKNEWDVLDFETQKKIIASGAYIVVTNGSQSIAVYYNKNKKIYPLEKVAHPRNTVGAGDTFFASITKSLMIDLLNQDEAIDKAAHIVFDFLSEK